MTDKERVIKGLESLHDRLLDAAKQDAIATLDASMVADALALLKAQPEENEAETRTRHDIRLMLRDHVIGFCPECKEICIKAVNPSFCGSCGQAVKWE